MNTHHQIIQISKSTYDPIGLLLKLKLQWILIILVGLLHSNCYNCCVIVMKHENVFRVVVLCKFSIHFVTYQMVFFLGQVSCKKRILLCNSSPPINRTFNEADKCLIRAHKKCLVRGWSPQIGLYCTLRSLPFLKITRILTTPHGTPKLLEIFSIVLFEGI